MSTGFQPPQPAPAPELPRSAAELEALRQADRAQVTQAMETFIQQQVAIQVAEQVKAIVEQWHLARHRMFGASSEAQLGLFNEAELEAADAVDDEVIQSDNDTAPPATPRPRRRGKRRPLPEHLPRIEHVVDVADEQRQCACGTPRVRIGEEVSERLDIVPMKIRVIRTVRPRYGCPKGDHAPIAASAVPEVLPRSQFSAGFLAMLLVTKYADGLPLNRFAKVLQRHGVAVPRQSLARAVIQTSTALQPLYNLAEDTLHDGTVMHMDESPIQVLKEADKKPTSQSYMWVRRGGPPRQPVVLFHYDPSRAGQVPKRLLADWRGYLMTDDYRGYNEVARIEGITHLACAAHARRKFVEAQRVQPKGKASRADEALRYFARLYRIERRYKEASIEQRGRARQRFSRLLLAEFKAWLDDVRPQITPKSKLGEALNYLHNVWPKLSRYIERGDLPIDNNACENAIRPFVVGRKGWLFADTPAGADASAIIYSLIETAKANNQEPYAWLRFVLERLPWAKTFNDMEVLMPWNLHEQDLAMNLAACE